MDIKTKIEIKSVFGDLIFEFEKENNTIKDTLLEAIKHGANLRNANLCGADLYDANLRNANLYGADLYDANLYDANLCGANLRNANLCGANLRNADLYGANLRNADLYGADLYGANLCGANGNIVGIIEDWMNHDNIGSRKSRTLFFKTDKGVFVQCGCFFGNLDEFVDKVKETHQGNKHERDYLALVEFIKVRFEL
jgi:hypothetical protein